MKVALVCIAKNEDNYIKEWVDYHFKLGFDSVVIYQNDWRSDLRMDNVHLINFDGSNKQREAYNNFLKHWHTEYDWVAFFDVDEFLVLKKHSNVKDFIREYERYESIGINWVLFGNNGLEFDGNYSVLNRFTKRQVGVFHLVKCIVRANPNIIYDVHHPLHKYSVDTNHRMFRGGVNPNGDDNIAQLNHYFCKTHDEWIVKKNRGRIDLSPQHHDFIRNERDYEVHNMNDIEDKSALDFFNSH